MSEKLKNPDLDRKTLRERICKFYDLLNEQRWDLCFSLIDPKLRDSAAVDLAVYSESMSGFFEAFGPIRNVSVEDLKLYADVQDNRHDDRDFAYASVLWDDRNQNQHKAQERWVRAADGSWYTRKVGMV